jgi:hypothetical protein
MSTIFDRETRTTTRPRPDATIRIQFFGPDDTKWGGEWRVVQLFEFHPDFDVRAKFRSYAYTSIPDGVLCNGRYHEGVYHIMGLGYLQAPYLEVRELSIHPDDLAELMDYCRAQRRPAEPLIVHPCPLPFPMFRVGDRVTVVGPDTWQKTERIGACGTITADSSGGGMSTVHFDVEAYNRGSDGRLYPEIGMPSASLRLLEAGEHLQVVRSKRKRVRKDEE